VILAANRLNEYLSDSLQETSVAVDWNDMLDTGELLFPRPVSVPNNSMQPAKGQNRIESHTKICSTE
jgi:hypothetical protein